MACGRLAPSTRPACPPPRSSCAASSGWAARASPTGTGRPRRWAWPSADWGSLPVEGGTEAAYRAELEAADDPAATLAGIRERLDGGRNPLRTAERVGI